MDTRETPGRLDANAAVNLILFSSYFSLSCVILRDLKERVIVVTGGNRGIGHGTCRQLANQDLIVVLTSRQEEDGLKAAADFTKRELSVRCHQLDVTDPSQILKLKDFLSQEFGRCDGLVNNAGVFLDDKDEGLLHTDVSTVRETMETNVYGPTCCVKPWCR